MGLKLHHRLILYPLVFGISFFIGLEIKNKLYSSQTTSTKYVTLKNNIDYLALDPIIPEKGYVNLTKNGYYFIFNFTYYSNSRYCINGTIFSIRSGTYDLRGCSWEGKLNITHIEKELSYSGMGSLLQTVIDLIFFTNRLLAANKIKIENKEYSGFANGTFAKINNNCYKIELKNKYFVYTKYFCLNQQSAKSS